MTLHGLFVSPHRKVSIASPTSCLTGLLPPLKSAHLTIPHSWNEPCHRPRKPPPFVDGIVAILNEGDAGIPIAAIIRKHGISRQTFFGWRRKYRWGLGLTPEAAEGARGGEREAEAALQRSRA